MNFTIMGTGSALPQRTLSNNDLCAFFDTSDEWIRTRTGIGQRHIMDTENVTALSVLAAQRAMESAGVTAADIDYILCPTIGGDYITPNLACMVQQGIGANCPAMDINAACSGFIYGLDVAAAFLARGTMNRVLLVAAEGLSRVVDWNDRATAVLFGDGAGAVVLAPGDDMKYIHLTAQGCQPPLYIRFPEGNFPGKVHSSEPQVHMDGAEVYKFAVNAISTGIATALEKTGLAPEDVNHVLLHQANIRIIEAAQRKLGIPTERYAINIQDVGNMSAASIPVLMDQCNQAGRFAPGDYLVLSGFGGGFTTGTAVLQWGRA